MLVEINLLPQKQRKRSTIIRIILLLLFLFLVSTLLTVWQVQRYNNSIKGLQTQITNFQQTIDVLQQNEKIESTNSYVELSNAVNWSSSYQIKSVAVLKQLTSLLPERGFLLTYSYTEAGTILITVQFDTKKEAAYYLKWLGDSEWINEVKLTQLTSSQLESTQTNNGTEDGTDDLLPRYTGSYEITLNRENILQSQQKMNNSKDTGTEGDNE